VDSKDVLTTLAKATAGALLIASAYSLPALVAVHGRHDRSEAIALLNLLLGWTVVGWLVLLPWALRWEPRRSHLWRRLSGGRDGGPWRASPGSSDSSDGVVSRRLARRVCPRAGGSPEGR
jgi:hypothetical protein